MKIGITERGDAVLNLEWIKKMDSVDFAIIITKGIANAGEEFKSALKKYQNKIILHATCTGLGKKLEPNVPDKIKTRDALRKLDFPKEQIVLRVDPIIPTDMGIEKAHDVLMLFCQEGIKRVRFSFIDMYPHVTERFVRAGISQHPYKGQFSPSQQMIDAAENMLRGTAFHKYEFESCAERPMTKYEGFSGSIQQVGCISRKDFDILGIHQESQTGGFQRKGCLCCAGKTELLTSKKKCPHGCLYCYWKD